MPKGRAHRLLSGLGLGYVHTFGAVLVGLWLTPFLLHQLGSREYGLWLLGGQVVFYLALLDLGVVALVPREIARASGLNPSDSVEAMQEYIGQTLRVVLLQLPAVALVGGVIVWLLPHEWAPLRGPLVVVVLVFVAAFPFRVFIAVLQGLQDLTFVGVTQLASWATGTLVTIGGIFGGLGLYSLSLGWVTTQVFSATLSWVRLARAFPHLLPTRLPSLTRAAWRQQVDRGIWISVSQVAQVLLSGTDLIIVGKFLGPEAVVRYACTGKLITLLANQPQLFLQLALPALSEMRVSAPQRLLEVSRSMTQLTLLASGAIVAVVLVANETFVTWWVGDAQFAGAGLTLLLLAVMLFRHLNTTVVYGLFCYGNEQRVALTTIGEGLAGAAFMLVFVPTLGLYGVALGSLAATCVFSLSTNLRALARDQQTSAASLLRPLGPWAIRMLVLLTGLALGFAFVPVEGLIGLILVSLGVVTAYGLVMMPVLRKPPLGTMVWSSLEPLMNRLWPSQVMNRSADNPEPLT